MDNEPAKWYHGSKMHWMQAEIICASQICNSFISLIHKVSIWAHFFAWVL